MKGFRTVLFNIAAALPLAFDFISQSVHTVEQSEDIRGLIPEEFLPAYGVIVALVNVWLRMKTDTPIGKKTPTEAIEEKSPTQ